MHNANFYDCQNEQIHRHLLSLMTIHLQFQIQIIVFFNIPWTNILINFHLLHQRFAWIKLLIVNDVFWQKQSKKVRVSKTSIAGIYGQITENRCFSHNTRSCPAFHEVWARLFPGSMYLMAQKNDSHTHFKSVHISLEVLMSTPKLKTNRAHGS